MPPSHTMRVAVVGLGAAGMTLHLPALRAIPGVTLVAGVDPDPARRHAAERGWALPTFPDLDVMLPAVAPDVVVVATPPDLHHAHSLASLEAGAHIICEKPFAASVAEADEIIAAARAAGRQVALNHEFRAMPIFRAVQAAAGGAAVGPLRFVQAWQNLDLAPWSEPGWRGALQQRTLYEAGVHLLDLLLVLFDASPTAVSAAISGGGTNSASDAVVSATIEFADGRVAVLFQNRLCRGEAQYFEIRADGATGSARASFGGRARISAGLYHQSRPHLRMEWGASGLAWVEQGARRTVVARNPKNPNLAATRDILAGTLRAFASESAPPVSAMHGRNLLLVTACCYLSAARGTRVEIPITPSEEIRAFRMGRPPDPGTA